MLCLFLLAESDGYCWGMDHREVRLENYLFPIQNIYLTSLLLGYMWWKCTPAVEGFFYWVLCPQRLKAVENRPNTVSCNAKLEERGSVPPAMSYCTACPSKELLRCELLAIPAAIYSMLVYYEMYSKLWHHQSHNRKAEKQALHVHCVKTLWLYSTSPLYTVYCTLQLIIYPYCSLHATHSPLNW